MSTVIVAGPLANKPFNAGAAWTRMSYVVGLRNLGFSVFFVEQISEQNCIGSLGRPSAFESSVNLQYFRDVTEAFDLAGSSALLYGNAERIHGVARADLYDLASEAEILINISGHLSLPDLKLAPRRRVYIDLDPGYTQFWHARGQLSANLADHDAYFTVGGNIGTPQCAIPTNGIPWRPTRPLFVADQWPVVSNADGSRFTTVASWRGGFGPVEFEGRSYGQKVHEFRKFRELPRRSDGEFEVALDIDPADRADRDALIDNGWRVVSPLDVCPDPKTFRDYVQRSGAEFSVAQGVYVDTNSGWFSDRTVRYLASGRPALVQDTGFASTYPVGEGLVTFSTLDEAVAGATDILDGYERHAKAARALAEEFFDSRLVLTELLDDAGASS